jgi:hypothetical protein
LQVVVALVIETAVVSPPVVVVVVDLPRVKASTVLLGGEVMEVPEEHPPSWALSTFLPAAVVVVLTGRQQVDAAGMVAKVAVELEVCSEVAPRSPQTGEHPP